MQVSNRENFLVSTGKIGEEIVNELLANSVRTEDWYDSKKDGTYNDLKYEVKTFRLNNKTQSFWVDRSQWNKVDGVDMLFFVRVPENENEGLNVYLCINHRKCWKECKRNDGVIVRGYPLTSCIPYGTINDDRAKVVYENSVATSVHRRYANV